MQKPIEVLDRKCAKCYAVQNLCAFQERGNPPKMGGHLGVAGGGNLGGGTLLAHWRHIWRQSSARRAITSQYLSPIPVVLYGVVVRCYR